MTRGVATLDEVSAPLHLTVLFEEGEDGWVVARIREVPAAMSQGRTRDEARENVLDALRELVLSYLDEGEQSPLPEGVSSEELTITLAR
jgi:predicted RNase H-like HicB family nuclease